MSKYMTPDQARELLDGKEVMWNRSTLCTALETIADEQVEYSQQVWHEGEWRFIYADLWFDSPDDCSDLWTDIEPWKHPPGPFAVRTVARRVSSPWVVLDDE